MEKIWHKKKKDQNFVDHNCKCYGISMMLGVMSIMSYAELFDDL